MSEAEPRRMGKKEALNKQNEVGDIHSFVEAIVLLAPPNHSPTRED